MIFGVKPSKAEVEAEAEPEVEVEVENLEEEETLAFGEDAAATDNATSVNLETE